LAQEPSMAKLVTTPLSEIGRFLTIGKVRHQQNAAEARTLNTELG